MPWLENFWHTYNRFPFPEEWLDRFAITPQQVDSILVNPLFKRSCKARGITPNFWEKGFNERQQTTIALLANIGDGRPVDKKLASIGVTQAELEGWYQIPEFKSTLESRLSTNLGNFKPEAMGSLARNVKKGNQRSIEYYLKLVGEDEAPEVANLKRAMQLIVDSVQRHVKDPAVLESIKADLMEIL